MSKLALAAVAIGLLWAGAAAARAAWPASAPASRAGEPPAAETAAPARVEATTPPGRVAAAPASGEATALPEAIVLASPAPAVMDEPRDEAGLAPEPAEPPRLLIPDLDVNAPVISIPVKDGNWDLSELNAEIGWLSTTGSQPGDDLAMAFVGHFTLAGAKPGPLAGIWDTRPGDEIIYRARGTDYVYAIEGRQTVGPNDVEHLYVNDGERLILVTCTNWDFLNWEYSDRLVVQAALVRQTPSP
ncbi:MAG: class F sortase [Anaerolineales bacterium]|nr:class F sortase [Anaerolineales bacterium]